MEKVNQSLIKVFRGVGGGGGSVGGNLVFRLSVRYFNGIVLTWWAR